MNHSYYKATDICSFPVLKNVFYVANEKDHLVSAYNYLSKVLKIDFKVKRVCLPKEKA